MGHIQNFKQEEKASLTWVFSTTRIVIKLKTRMKKKVSKSDYNNKMDPVNEFHLQSPLKPTQAVIQILTMTMTLAQKLIWMK